MNFRSILSVSALTFALTAIHAHAFEFGSSGWVQKPGLTIGVPAANPPEGLYMFNQTFTYQSEVVGPGAPNIGGEATDVSFNVTAFGLVWVPGTTFLGGSYSAKVIQPISNGEIDAPVDFDATGLHNTYISPVELSWKLGESGFFVKTEMGVYLPTGAVKGANGLESHGNPWWTFQPGVVVSYLNDGLNLTANVFYEINTESWKTDYRSGDILHAEFTATKTIGNWTVGPAGYYSGQVSDDRSSAFYNGAINANRYDTWAVGALIGYDFGPAKLDFWALKEFSSKASGGTAAVGRDSAAITKGWTAFARISFPLGSVPAPSVRQ